MAPMVMLLVFACALYVGALISELVERSVLSTAVVFLVIGVLAGAVGHAVRVDASGPALDEFASLALFSVLFTDGMRAGVGDVRAAWQLPGRALLLGLPLTMVGTAAVVHALAHFSWSESLLIGAVLSPTDPVFAAAIVGRQEIPNRVRLLLNVESGLNDGLALPAVMMFLALAGGSAANLRTPTLEAVSGVIVGAALPFIALRLRRARAISITQMYEPFTGFALGLMIFAVSSLVHGNLFLAAFVGGAMAASTDSQVRDQFQLFGERVTELLKLAVLLIFGAQISMHFFTEINLAEYVIAAVLLVLVRPAALGLSLLGSGLTRRERLVAEWFGPKGFASVVYGLLIAKSTLAAREQMFHLIALVVIVSIVAHSSTDVLVARLFESVEGPASASPDH